MRNIDEKLETLFKNLNTSRILSKKDVQKVDPVNAKLHIQDELWKENKTVYVFNLRPSKFELRNSRRNLFFGSILHPDNQYFSQVIARKISRLSLEVGLYPYIHSDRIELFVDVTDLIRVFVLDKLGFIPDNWYIGTHSKTFPDHVEITIPKPTLTTMERPESGNTFRYDYLPKLDRVSHPN